MSEKSYPVGYKKPPFETRFVKGRSGNPKGRPRGSVGLKTDLIAELSERLPITERGQQRSHTKQRIVLKALTNKAMSGDMRASAKLLDMIVRVIGLDEPDTRDSDLSAADQEILREFLRRQNRKGTE